MLSCRDARLCFLNVVGGVHGIIKQAVSYTEGGEEELEWGKLGHFNFMNEFLPD